MNRRQARQVALQALYQMDVGGAQIEDAIRFATSCLGQDSDVPGFDEDSEALGFARQIVSDAWARLGDLDSLIRPNLKGWVIDRLPRIDLCIIRLALCEMLTRDTPRGVVINEAVELAKEFSTSESGKFINGVLASLAKVGL